MGTSAARSIRRPVLWFCTVLAVVALIRLRTATLQPEGRERYGLYTEAQILRRSDETFRVLTPQTGGLRASLQPSRFSGRKGQIRHWWAVDYTAHGDSRFVHMKWDGDNGELIQVSNMVPVAREAAEPVVDQAEAAQAAQYWMRRLGVAGGGPPWELQRSPERLTTYGTWKVRVRRQDRRALIFLDAASGQLRLFQSFPRT
uniref:Uncharacterized protein n=1 Tax=uncultured Armatimonadetes bacterium TaxID=157466 RepID=A0A6J4HFY4_9BACT|nr:hypothetical protein AVDCRST_MAG63-731 [uncultured Armatimonadetes bacterium]